MYFDYESLSLQKYCGMFLIIFSRYSAGSIARKILTFLLLIIDLVILFGLFIPVFIVQIFKTIYNSLMDWSRDKGLIYYSMYLFLLWDWLSLAIFAIFLWLVYGFIDLNSKLMGHSIIYDTDLFELGDKLRNLDNVIDEENSEKNDEINDYSISIDDYKVLEYNMGENEK